MSSEAAAFRNPRHLRSRQKSYHILAHHDMPVPGSLAIPPLNRNILLGEGQFPARAGYVLWENRPKRDLW
jgi:hypothetical protein